MNGLNLPFHQEMLCVHTKYTYNPRSSCTIEVMKYPITYPKDEGVHN